MIPESKLKSLKPLSDQLLRSRAIKKGRLSPKRKKIKHHCHAGHTMKREGDMFRCLGMVNSKEKNKGEFKKIKHRATKPWSRVTGFQGLIN